MRDTQATVPSLLCVQSSDDASPTILSLHPDIGTIRFKSRKQLALNIPSMIVARPRHAFPVTSAATTK